MSENDDIAKAELGCEKVDDSGLVELKAELEALKAKIIAGLLNEEADAPKGDA